MSDPVELWEARQLEDDVLTFGGLMRAKEAMRPESVIEGDYAEVVIHQCPPDGSGIMPCCGRTPFEVLADRMTDDPSLVTCGEGWSNP